MDMLQLEQTNYELQLAYEDYLEELYLYETIEELEEEECEYSQ